MKKILFFLFTVLLCINFAVAANAADDAPLIIVDATRRTPYADALEGFTVKNVSDKAVDLSDYKVWYGTAKTEEALATLDATTVNAVMALTDEVGKYILQPGQMAYIWIISSATYKNDATTADGEVFLIEQGADGKPVYRTDLFRKAVDYMVTSGTYRTTAIAEDMPIVPVDRTTGEAFGPDGTYKNKKATFNLVNSAYIRLYLTEYNSRGAEEAFCTADLDGTGNGTYLNASGAVKVTYGTYIYTDNENEVAMTVSSFEAGTFLFGNELVPDIILEVEPVPDGAFRVMTVNALNDDTRTSRFSYIEKSVETLNPDIVGFQECREGFNAMLDNIKGLGYATAVATLVDDPLDGTIINCVPILYKTDKYTLVEGSAGARRFAEKYGDSWTKSLCYCVLEDNETKERIIVVNSHFEVYNASRGVPAAEVFAQRESNAREVLAQIETLQEKYGDLPAVAIGDFNMDEPESAYRILQTGLRDAVHLGEESYPWLATYHKGLEGTQTGEYPIDHVFVTSEDFRVIRVMPYTDTIGKKASDHYPLYADLELKAAENTTCAETHLSDTPLQIVDATRRTSHADALEGFTVMNVSDKPVDLSHILVWYATAKTDAELKERNAAAITYVMRMSEKTGKNILNPGEKAFIWCISSATYKNQVDTADGKVYLIEEGEDGFPVYRTDLFRKAVQYIADGDTYTASMIEDNTKIIPLDRTTRDAFGPDGTYHNLSKSFNLVNSSYLRLYLTYDTAYSAEDAFSIADLDGTNDGTYINDEGAVAVNYGTYKYLPTDGAQMQVASFDKDTYYFGTNTEGFSIVVSEKTVVKMTIGQDVGYINDVAKTLDAAPIIRESRTMLPVRFVAEAFGAEVGWDGATSTATVKTTDVEIKITIGSKTALVNGAEVALDAPAFIENSRTYMPVRFVAENLGATVAWDGATSTATLVK